MGGSGSGSPWRKLLPCLNPLSVDEAESSSDVNKGCSDGFWWYKDSGKHVNGEFSMAVIKGNDTIKDYIQLESGPLSSVDSKLQGTFVGIYDGHGGTEASRYIADHLFEKIRGSLSRNREISASISSQFQRIDEEFLSVVRREWESKPTMGSVGSCCLVGLVCNGVLCIANAGDSRAVLGKLDNINRHQVNAEQLSTEHNANIESIRNELKALHPDDPDIVMLKPKGVWRLKGIIKVTRSIGDAYLKSNEFQREPLAAKYMVPGGIQKPIMSADPSTSVHVLCADDQFLILASDGLWDHITNQEAVDIVNKSQREGVARELVKAALHKAAAKTEITYEQLMNVVGRLRRLIHDDISVIVLYLDHKLKSSKKTSVVSLKWGSGGD